MKIHQAFFGDKEGSHNLLATSIHNQQLIGRLKSITDSPASININKPYLSGYYIEDHYIFCLTMSDPTAKRGGMVFSHCLIIYLDQIKSLNNLDILFQQFVKKPQKNTIELSDLEIDHNRPFTTPKPSIYDTLIHYLIKDTKTLIYLGYKDFEQSIQYLWYHLPNTLRKTFSFTISGSPNELIENDYTLVYSPTIHSSRWGEYNSINSPENIANDSLTHLFLSGSNDIEVKSLNQFIDTNHIKLDHLSQLSNISKCHNLINELNTSPTFPLLRRIISLLSKIIPNPQEGTNLKDSILQKLIIAIPNTDYNNIKSIRNISSILTSFETGLEQIKKVFKIWVDKNICSKSIISTKNLVELLLVAFKEQNSNWWHRTIKDRIKWLCVNMDSPFAIFIWSIWKSDIAFISTFKELINQESEEFFLKTFPLEQQKEWYQEITTFALNKKWLSLYALSNINQYSLKHTFELQIEHDTKKSLCKNLLLISEKVSPKEFILTAVTIKSPPLHKIAGELCAKNIHILKLLDITQLYWQTIWLASYHLTNDLTKGVDNIQNIFYSLLDLLLESKKINLSLLEAVEKYIDNVFNYHARKDIWVLLPIPTKERLLDKTSIFAIKNRKDININDLEDDILNHIRTDTFIYKNIIESVDFGLKTKIALLEKLEILDEEYAIQIIKRENKIHYSEVDYISEKIKKYSWQKLLNHLYDHSKRYGYYTNGILNRCKSLLGFFKRMFIKKNTSYKSKQEVIDLIDKGDISDVFSLLDTTIKDPIYTRIKDEYIAGVEGIKRRDLCDRLKAFINQLDT